MKGLEHNWIGLSTVYFKTTKNVFQKILVELPKKICHKKKCQSLLHSIGGG